MLPDDMACDDLLKHCHFTACKAIIYRSITLRPQEIGLSEKD